MFTERCSVPDGADTLDSTISSSLSLTRNCERGSLFLFLVSVAWLSARLAPCWPVLNCRRALSTDVHTLLADFGTYYRLLVFTTSVPLFDRLSLIMIINCQLTYVLRALLFLLLLLPAQLQAQIREQ